MDGSRDTIPTNLRQLLVLEELARLGSATATEVNAKLGLPKPTIHRLFATLEEEGFVQRTLDGRGWEPGPRARAMSAGLLSTTSIRAARLAILRDVSREIGETCNIALPGNDGMVYLERVETEWPLRIQLPVGTRVPFHCTASGKLFLSSLPTAARQRFIKTLTLRRYTANTITDGSRLDAEASRIDANGHATDNGEFMDGMIAVGVPVHDANGRLLATLTSHAPVQRMDLSTALTFLPRMQQAARELGSLVTPD